MRRLKEFLDTQYAHTYNTRLSYEKAIKWFDAALSVSGFSGEFEDNCDNPVAVHAALAELKKKYAGSSWNTCLIRYKRYAKWLCDPEDLDAPKFWKKIKPIRIDWEMKLKDKWLSEEEFLKILDKVDYAKNKAMYGVAVEGALRPGELLGLKIRDCQAASYGFDVTVSGKTGTSSFPVVLFAPFLRQWLNLHPNKHNPDASLWPTRRFWHSDETVSESQFMATLDFKKYAKLAGITRPVSLHILRHTKISWTAKNTKVGVSDEMAKKMFRWSKNSRMYARYSHLFGVDSTKTYLALAGVKLESDEVKREVLAVAKCLNCGVDNAAGGLFCASCGFPLSAEAAKDLLDRKRMEAELLKMQPELMKLLKEKLKRDAESNK